MKILPASPSPLLLLLSVSSLLLNCAAELDDPEAFAGVEQGVGAAGVRPPGATNTTAADTTAADTTAADTTAADTTAADTTAADTTAADTTAADTTAAVDPVQPTARILTAECQDVPTRIFAAKCNGSSCHGEPGAPPSGLSDFVSTTDLAGIVLNVSSTNVNCGLLVDGSNPADSAITSAVGSAPCSAPMPLVGDKLTADELRCVTEWVQAVAAGEDVVTPI